MTDNDGQCSATLIRQLLNKQHNIDPVIYIRKGKAHGLRAAKDEDIVKQIIANKIQLLIVPDAGVNDVEPCKELLEHGCKVLVLDHHQIETDNPYAVIINHHLGVGLNTALSGTGVTAKFIQWYCQKYGYFIPYMDDLIAMSIISDSCDITSMENRYYVHKGLHNVKNPMIQAMLPSVVNRYGLTPKGYSWAMIPLINAVCREEEVENKYKIFDAFSGHGDIEEALKICRASHRKQTEVVKQAVEEIERSLDTKHKVIIGFADKSLANQVGLIANKFQSKYHKPVIVLREADPTTWSGSLRSPIPLLSIINESGYAKALGHSAACGTILRKSNLQRFIDYLDNIDIPLEPEIEVAVRISPKQINNQLCKACENNNELWGQGLKEPNFYISTEIDESNVQVFEKKTITIKITIDGIDFLLFMAKPEDVEKLTQKDKKNLSCIITLGTNTWNGVTKPQAKIVQYEIDEVKNRDWEDNF